LLRLCEWEKLVTARDLVGEYLFSTAPGLAGVECLHSLSLEGLVSNGAPDRSSHATTSFVHSPADIAVPCSKALPEDTLTADWSNDRGAPSLGIRGLEREQTVVLGSRRLQRFRPGRSNLHRPPSQVGFKERCIHGMMLNRNPARQARFSRSISLPRPHPRYKCIALTTEPLRRSPSACNRSHELRSEGE
jgi:hypothetical protein